MKLTCKALKENMRVIILYDQKCFIMSSSRHVYICGNQSGISVKPFQMLFFANQHSTMSKYRPVAAVVYVK